VSRVLAVDFQPHDFLVAEARSRAGRWSIQRLLHWQKSSPAFSPETARELGTGLKQRLRSAGIAPGPMILAIGRDRVILKELRFPAVPPADEPNLVRFQALKETSESPEDVVVDYVPHASQVAEGERRVTAAIVSKTLIQAAQEFAEAAGCKLTAVTPRPFLAPALIDHAVATGAIADAVPASDAIALLHLRTDGGELTVVHNRTVIFARSWPQAVVESEPALIAEVKRNLAVLAGSLTAPPLGAILLPERPGGGAAERLGSALPVPVVAFDPLHGTQVVAQPVDVRDHYAGVVGLLAKAPTALSINFIHPRQPKSEPNPLHRQILAVSLLGSLLLAVGIGYGILELNASSRTLQRLILQKMDLETEKAQVELDAKRVRLVEEWQTRSPVWLDELYDLADRFERFDDTRVSSITMSTLPPDKTGKRSASGRIEIKLATRDPQAVTDLVTAINRDNTGPQKHYVAVQKTTGGLASGGSPFNQLFTITALVNRRPPEEYTRQLPIRLSTMTASTTPGTDRR